MTQASSKSEHPAVEGATVERFVEAFDGLIRAIIVANSHKAAHKLGMGPQDVRGLLWLGAQGPSLMSTFAKGVGVPLSTATHLANRLLEKEVITRSRSDEDRRVVHVRLSPAGERLYGKIFKQRASRSRDLLGKLNEPEQKQIVALMQKLLCPEDQTTAPRKRSKKEKAK